MELAGPAAGDEDQRADPGHGGSREVSPEDGSSAAGDETGMGSLDGSHDAPRDSEEHPRAPAEQHRILTDRRLRVWGIPLAVGLWWPLIGAVTLNFWDFDAFYSAGALIGRFDLSRLAPVVAYEVDHGWLPTPFVNPPAYALLYAPLAHLPYIVAGLLSLAIMTALLLLAVEYGRRPFGLPRPLAFLGALAWAPAALGVVSGQTSALSLCLVVAVMAGLGRSTPRGSVAAGLAVAALAYKPQLAVPLLLLLLVRRDWRALLASMAGVGVLYLGSVAATGGNWGWPADWLATIQAYAGPDFAQNGWQVVGLVGMATRIGIPAAAYVAGGLLTIWLLPKLRSWRAHEAVALACALGLMASPHALVYDATLLLPALAMLTSHRREIVTLYLMAAIWPAAVLLGWQPLAIGVAAVPLMLACVVQTSRGARTGRSGALASNREDSARGSALTFQSVPACRSGGTGRRSGLKLRGP